MPSIEKISLLPSAPFDTEWREKRSFPSPDGTWAVEFYDPFEFHMGTYRWLVRLLENGKDVSFRHLFRLGRNLLCPHAYQPWSCDSLRILLTNMDSEVYLYDVGEKKRIRCQLEGPGFSVLGSRKFARFVVCCRDNAVLLDMAGEVIRELAVKPILGEHPWYGWFDAASRFFGLGRAAQSTRIEMQFYEAMTGERRETLSLDPMDLVPYEATKYAEIRRDRMSLVLSKSHRCVGYFLDVWSEMRFDEANCALHLRVYRPVGELFAERDETRCKVEAQWVEVQLKP